MIRESFTKKYSDLPTRWNIDSDIVFYILRRYEKLLSSEIEKLKTEWMQLPKYFKDKRTDEEYIYDIIDWWVMEDIICDARLRPRLLKINKDIEIKVMGTNRDRVIQKYNSNNITTNPDFIFSIWWKDIGIELQMARSVLKNWYDMKDSKVQRAFQNWNYFLWVIIPNNEFFIINPQKEMNDMKPQANPLWWGKMVYHISQSFIENIGWYSKMNEDINDLYLSKLWLWQKK